MPSVVPDRQRLSARAFARCPATYVDRVYAGGESFILTRNGKPRAALVPVVDEDLPAEVQRDGRRKRPSRR